LLLEGRYWIESGHCYAASSNPDRLGSQTANELFSVVACASDERVDYTDELNSIRKNADISVAYRHLHVTGQPYRSRPNRKQPPTAISGSNPDRSATEPANLLSGLACVANEASFTGLSAHKTTTMSRTIGLQIRPAWALSPRFLRAMIVEWLFPMQFDKTPAGS